MTTLKFPPNDEFMSFCRTEGFPNNYNDCLKATLQNDLGSSNPSIGDLMRAHFDRFQDDDYFSVANEAFRIIKSYGTDAHVYLPGIGVINGLTADNYLDSAGTTAATVDNPVGLVLDAAGSVGSELVTNGDFSTDTTWTKGTGWSIAGGVATHIAGSSAYLSQTTTLTSGRTFLFTFTVTGRTAGTVGARLENASNRVVSVDGVYSEYIVTNSNNPRIIMSADSAFNGSVDNVSVKEVTGIHATQATTANKPILRRGAVNLLTYSEQFDNAAWSKLNATVTANATTAPDGTSTMDKLVETAVSGVHYTRQSYAVTAATAYTFTQSVYVKAGERNVNLGFTSASPYVNSGAFNPTTGAWVTANNQGGVGFSFVSRTATLVGDTWRVSLTISISTASTQTSIFTQVNLYNGSSDVYLGDGTSGAFIWGAMLNVGTLADYIPTTTAPASSATGNYHWVHDSTDVLTATFPAGYEAATIINTAETGQVTYTGQNIVGTYDIRGAEIGSELVTNGDFSNGTTGWTPSNSTLSVVDGRLRVTNTGAVFGYAYQAIPTTVGKLYVFTGSSAKETANAQINIGTSAGGTQLGQTFVTSTSPTNGSVAFVATSTTTYISALNQNISNGTASYDNLSVREATPKEYGRFIFRTGLTASELTTMQTFANRLAGV